MSLAHFFDNLQLSFGTFSPKERLVLGFLALLFLRPLSASRRFLTVIFWSLVRTLGVSTRCNRFTHSRRSFLFHPLKKIHLLTSGDQTIAKSNFLDCAVMRLMRGEKIGFRTQTIQAQKRNHGQAPNIPTLQTNRDS